MCNYFCNIKMGYVNFSLVIMGLDSSVPVLKKTNKGFKRDWSHVKLCTHVESTAASNPVLIVGEEH